MSSFDLLVFKLYGEISLTDLYFPCASHTLCLYKTRVSHSLIHRFERRNVSHYARREWFTKANGIIWNILWIAYIEANFAEIFKPYIVFKHLKENICRNANVEWIRTVIVTFAISSLFVQVVVGIRLLFNFFCFCNYCNIFSILLKMWQNVSDHMMIVYSTKFIVWFSSYICLCVNIMLWTVQFYMENKIPLKNYSY